MGGGICKMNPRSEWEPRLKKELEKIIEYQGHVKLIDLSEGSKTCQEYIESLETGYMLGILLEY